MLHIARPIRGAKLPSIRIRPSEHAPYQNLTRAASWWPALPSAALVQAVDVAKGPNQTRKAHFFLIWGQLDRVAGISSARYFTRAGAKPSVVSTTRIPSYFVCLATTASI